MRPIRVVAAVIERGGRLLLGLRPAEKRHGGLWEFPGGKLDGVETAAEAAHREIKEELSLEVTAVRERLTTIRDEGSPFVIEFYPVVAEGEPSGDDPRAGVHEVLSGAGWRAAGPRLRRWT